CVIPAKAGIQGPKVRAPALGPRFRGGDGQHIDITCSILERPLARADIDVTQELPLPVERPRPVTSGPLAWLRANLFNSIPNTILTLIALYLLAVPSTPVIRWGVVDAIWHAESGRACRSGGACWAFIAEKGRFILFGRF